MDALEFCVHGLVVHLRLGNCIGYSLREPMYVGLCTFVPPVTLASELHFRLVRFSDGQGLDMLYPRIGVGGGCSCLTIGHLSRGLLCWMNHTELED